ncbi:hypothetical protein Ahy_B09g098778 [Arachis hypogaea]|uniref:SWIM-type domain-containing protein n=1 Tax=Arachis hypogaea TaxID=3818 RepID=A0A444XS24_ARAHY|nr:hypothetical protein Ahy_B09g098778 [Arachis hypogaea]
MTNLVECINYVLKGTRNFPVTAIVRSTFYRLNELASRLISTFTTDSRIHNLPLNELKKVFYAQETLLSTGSTATMRCLRFVKCNMVERFPCCHILACYANQHLDWQVYIHDVYKMSKICKVYRGEFVPMGEPSTWFRYERAKVITSWTLRRMTKG